MKDTRHIVVSLVALFLLLGLPAMYYGGHGGFSGSADSVTGASLELPDQPGGEYLVLINKARHTDTLQEWTDFFQEKPVPVIFEDICCLAAGADPTACQLAERFQAQLPENQMALRLEDATLLASKAENGYIDVAVFSSEMAQALSLTPGPDVTVIRITGGDDA